MYGDNDQTNIKILKEGENIVEISCRIDLRNLSKFMLKKIIGYIKLIRGNIYYEGEIYEPQINNLVYLIKKSPENDYCKNPIEYVKSLNNKGGKE